jgi:phage terminase large subunit-like protein
VSDYVLHPDKIRSALETLEQMYPTLFWVPNVAQTRVLDVWNTKPYPFITMATPGNGTGKTCCMVQDIAGVYLGLDYVNAEWLRSEYYQEIRPLVDAGKFRGRIVCKAEDVKEGGSVYEEVRQWIPCAKFVMKTSSGYYQKIEIPLPGNPNIKNVVDIKTFDQEKTAHSGSNLHRIWMNEPPPPEIFGEEIGRTRSLKGKSQCHVLIFATVLDQSGYLWDMLDDPDMHDRIAHIEGCIWENCAGEDLPDHVGVKLGLKRGEDGVWITRGVLSRQSIENQIATWRRTCPAEAEAREWGKPMFLSGVIYKNFDPAVHVVKDFPIPRRYPIVQIVDPHPSRPDFSGWFAVTPMHELIGIHEWPAEPFELIKNRELTIEQTCGEWRRIESALGISNQIIGRYGDPNMFNSPDPATLQSLKMLYSAHGFNFNTNVNDDIEYGHRSVESLLYYDRERWIMNNADPTNRPKMLFFESCMNLTTAMQRYGRKNQRDPTAPPSEQIDKKYACVAGVIRYAAVSFPSFSGSVSAGEDRKPMSDYERMRSGRDKYRKFGAGKVESIKGRRVVSSVTY